MYKKYYIRPQERNNAAVEAQKKPGRGVRGAPRGSVTRMTEQGAERKKRRGVRPRLWISVVVQALVATSCVAVLNARADDDCWTPPRATVALAEDPARATRVLDPGTTAVQSNKITRLLDDDHWNTCEGPSGSRVLGRVLIAATTGKSASDTEGPALRHTEAMARVLHETVRTLGDRGQPTFPAEFRPYAARLLAAWPASVNMGVTGYSKESGAAMEPGGTKDARAYEARAVFNNDDQGTLTLKAVITTLAADPKSYATLYDALRAHAAVSLDPVRRDEAVPDKAVPDKAEGQAATDRTAHRRLEAGMETIAVLNHARDTHLAKGAIPDGAKFDAAVLRHSKGGYAASARPTSPAYPPEGSAALRTPAKSARAWAAEGAAATGHGERNAAAWFMDGPQQIRRTVNLWARDRDVPPADADRVRGSLDRSYQLTMKLRGVGSRPGFGY